MAHMRFRFVPGARLLGPVGSGLVGWRLLGGNNRELGRSATVYPNAEAAATSVARVKRQAAEATSRFTLDRASGTWSWSLDLNGEVVAISGRGFRRERECRYNLEQFRIGAPSAPFDEREAA